MRVSLFLFALTIAVSATASFAHADEAEELAAKAFKARFGNTDPAKMQKLASYSNGKTNFNGKEFPCKRDIATNWPDNFKITFVLGEGVSASTVIACHKGFAGWQAQVGGGAMDLTDDLLTDLMTDTNALRIMSTLSFKDPAVKLAMGTDKKDASGAVLKCLKITQKKWPEMTIYIKADDFMVAQVHYKSREAGTVYQKEFHFSDYKEFGGIKLPTKEKIFYNGIDRHTFEGILYMYPDKVDPKAFDKP
jgi:hypothetical protein